MGADVGACCPKGKRRQNNGGGTQKETRKLAGTNAVPERNARMFVTHHDCFVFRMNGRRGMAVN